MLDVIVIGLGAAGSAALRAAARRGLTCLGIEQFGIANDRGSSHGRSRLFRSGTSEGAEYVDLAARSLALWRELEKETGEEIVTVVGGLTIADPDSEVFLQTKQAMDDRDLPYEILDPVQIRSRYPQHYLREQDAGLLDPGTGAVRPELAITLSVAAARRDGAEVVTGVRVERVIEHDDHVEVFLNDDSIVTASRVIVAAGAWTAGLVPDLPMPLVVRRAVLSWFRPRDGHAGQFSPENFPVFTRDLEDIRGWGAPIIDDFGVKIGLHDQDGFEIDDPSTNSPDVAAWELERVEQFCARQFAGLVPIAQHAHGCMITLTPDERFAIGPTTPGSRIITLSACSGHGFKHSAAVGEMGVELALGVEATLDPAPFLPSRYTN